MFWFGNCSIGLILYKCTIKLTCENFNAKGGHVFEGLLKILSGFIQAERIICRKHNLRNVSQIQILGFPALILLTFIQSVSLVVYYFIFG